MDENDLVYRLRKRAEIRRNIKTRKSVQEGKPDRIADLLEEAAAALEQRPSIKTMVDRFLGWPLPEDFSPDAGISFKPIYNEGTPYQNRHRPIGTNLFNADQARQMFEYLLETAPAPETPTRIADEVLTCQDCGTTDGVRNTTCPFASEINGRELEITVCGNCRQRRAEDI